jgi:hypothetical protein
MVNKITQTQKKQKIYSLISKASTLEIELVWIPRIMSRQTDLEKVRGDTVECNNIGLSGVDGAFVSDLYAHVRSGKHLSFKQDIAVRRVLSKYWRQYTEMMHTKEPEQKHLS